MATQIELAHEDAARYGMGGRRAIVITRVEFEFGLRNRCYVSGYRTSSAWPDYAIVTEEDANRCLHPSPQEPPASALASGDFTWAAAGVGGLAAGFGLVWLWRRVKRRR